MRTSTVSSIDNLIRIASARMRGASKPQQASIKKAISLMRSAQSDIIAAAKGPFSAKERKQLGATAVIFDREAENAINTLRAEFTQAVLDRMEPAVAKLKKAIKAEHGNSGVAAAEDFFGRWFDSIVGKTFSSEFVSSLSDQISDMAAPDADDVADDKTEITASRNVVAKSRDVISSLRERNPRLASKLESITDSAVGR